VILLAAFLRYIAIIVHPAAALLTIGLFLIHIYMGCSRSAAGARLLLIGGPPFPETILMWWNFVARTPEKIARARTDWEIGDRFGAVRAYRGRRLITPAS
jgi:hypothetical protein